MPPPRRRRPVQPATRVRLPRAARARTVPADEPGPDTRPGAGNGQPVESATPGNGGGPAGVAVAGRPGPRTPDAVKPGTTAKPGGAAAPGPEPIVLPVLLGTLAVILGGLAVWFAVKAGGPATPSTAFGGPPTSNAAIVNRSATAQVNQQIDSAVDTIFSYNYADTAKTAQAARSLLTGRASQEYATLFRVVQQKAPAEKLVLTTSVTNSGVEMLSGDTARLLIFANQQDTSTSSRSTTDAGAMFSVTAVRQGGRWKIEDIDTFSAGG